MANRLLVDITAEGRTSVLLSTGDLPDSVGAPFDLAWPLDSDALEDLRWYLEDFLRAPYGQFADRGERVHGTLAQWGHQTFNALFASGPARDALVRLRDSGPRLEIVFRSPDARWLGLPWELLTDPARPTPLALSGIGVDRSLPSARLGNVFEAEGERLRVLMVIARPSGQDDVGFQMVARPLLQRLDAVRGRVDLVVLRPPTLERLHEVLTREGPFHIVHFDGHGVLGRSGADLGSAMYGAQAQGILVFEKPTGGPDHVEAERVAEVLAAGRVPIVVLNACQSGAMSGQIEAGVATRLLQGGASSVVAMAYSVFAVAAAEFMTGFYERLFAGDSVSQAVTAGRMRLSRNDKRPSPKGRLPLSDWLVPVHYIRREARFPGLKTAASAPSPPADEELEPVGVFVGRDALFYTLEAASRSHRAILLHGSGGTGKSEFAKAFGRWWRDSAGVDDPHLVIWHSCVPGTATTGLDSLITTVGLHVWGTDFALLERAQREQRVTELLRQHRALVIMDNFESLVTMPDPGTATPPLDEAEQERLRRFLSRVAKATVLITSRSSEAWLRGTAHRIEVPGLNRDEAVLYADELLQGSHAAQLRRERPAFADLMHWLDGHPLSMRLILPRLAGTDPEDLLDGLRGTAPLRDTELLDRCVAYSFAHLSADAAELLTAVSLLHGVADAQVLDAWSAQDEVPPRFAGHDRRKWTDVLAEAVGVGLLTELGGDMYRLHPALPSYLTARWRQTEYDAAWRAMLLAYSGFSSFLDQQVDGGNARLALTVIALQRHTMGALLAEALQQGQWAHAQHLVQALDQYWARSGRWAEADRWADRVQHALNPTGATLPTLDSIAGALWLYTTGRQASRHVTAGRLDKAQQTHQRTLGLLEAQPDSPDNRARIAVVYHQLGLLAQERSDHDTAESWFHRSLAIKEQLGDRPGLAAAYHQLGMTAQARGDYDTADAWYHRALAINEPLDNQSGLAVTYHHLGMTAQARGDYDTAEAWYHRSLAIEEQLGNRRGLAAGYGVLGTAAHEKGDYDAAQAWYLRSLAIEEQLGNRRGLAVSYGQLGVLASARGDASEAICWMIRAISVFDQFPPPEAVSWAPGNLKILADAEGVETVERLWVQTTGAAMPQALRAFLLDGEGQ